MEIDVKGMPTSLPPEIYRDKAFADKYVIEHELGIGGAGIVVGARHRELDERVAIKFLLPGQSNEAVARFRREARAASRIKNQHVVRINDVSTTDSGIPYIVMEYLEGVDLERMLQQSPKRQLPISDAIEFILQACEALAECHGLGIVHRDLKPSNLFCVHGADGLAMIKVLDFGISKLMLSAVEGDTTDHSRVLGSPRYMSPEQFDSSFDVDSRADIWAIGVILYELFAGVVPFVGKDVLTLWQKIRSETPAPIANHRPDVPARLIPVVMKCLQKDRERRYANLADLAKALLPFAPERARASVTRIVRTVESPGTMTSALDLPRLDKGAWSHSPTIQSLTPQVAAPVKTRARAYAIAVALAVVGALLWMVLRAGEPVATVGTPANAMEAVAPKAAPPVAAPTTVIVATEPSALSEKDAAMPAPSLATALIAAPHKAHARPAASVDAKPSPSPAAATAPVPSPALIAAPSATAPAAVTAAPLAAPTPSPWIVDIVEQRKTAP